MSPRTASQPQHGSRIYYTARGPARRAEAASRHPHGAVQAGYTIGHAGRQVRLGPVAFWIAVGTVVIMAGWSVITATYFAFHDDVIKSLIARQAAQQYAYEDRIADLRAQIDRTTSRQLLDQEQFEQKLDDLARRQATLESRADALSGAPDRTATGSIKPAPRGSGRPAKPSPLGELTPQQQSFDHREPSSIAARLDNVEASLDRVEGRETAALDRMESRYEGKTRLVRSVLASLGLNLSAPRGATGGPFVPVRLPPPGESFARAMTRVNIARAQDEDLGRTLALVPLRSPLAGDLEISSPFGVRVDPFLHQPSMHTGVDLRGNIGDPIRATADGKVTIAGWTGGYGQMVEIDHGDGLSTRYGHMSRIDVSVGEIVHAGQVVGRLGSTGRSTGPHLHYEIRVNGQPVNPERFLVAGAKLFGGQALARAQQRELQD